MKFKFILFTYFIFILFSCKSKPSKEVLLDKIKEEAFLLHKPIIVSSYHNNQKSNDFVTQLDYYIPVEMITEKNIQIEDNQISLTLPSPQFKKYTTLTNDSAIKNPLFNPKKIEELQNELQTFTSERIGNLMKSYDFKSIKIKYNSPQ